MQNKKIKHIKMKCYTQRKEEGGNMEKLLVLEFADNESAVFDDIMNILARYPDFQKYKLKDEPVLSIPGLEIRLERRKVYNESQEINLTTKEFDILCMLAVNRGRVVTYEVDYCGINILLKRVRRYGLQNRKVSFAIILNFFCHNFEIHLP